MMLVLNGAHRITSNLDVSWPTAAAPWRRSAPVPGGGALVAMLESATGQKAYSVGKPSPLWYTQVGTGSRNRARHRDVRDEARLRMRRPATPGGAPSGGPLADPAVRVVIREAWEDSAPHDPACRHEEGGYILQNDDGSYSVARWPRGGPSRIVPPPRAADGSYQGRRVIGEFHTHPNPAVDEWGRLWQEEPSPGDIAGIRREGYPADSYVIGHRRVYRVGNDGSMSDLGSRADVLGLSG